MKNKVPLTFRACPEPIRFAQGKLREGSALAELKFSATKPHQPLRIK
jgi:hypothetical protein